MQNYYEAFGQSRTLNSWVHWAQENLGITLNVKTLYNRIKKGMPVELAVSKDTVIVEQGRRRKGGKKLPPILASEDYLEQIVTASSQAKSPYNDDKTFYNGGVLDWLPQKGGTHDVVVLFRRSSSCVSYETRRGCSEWDIEQLVARKDVMRIERLR